MAYENSKEEVTASQVLLHAVAVVTILFAILWACVMFSPKKKDFTLSKEILDAKYGFIDVQIILNNAKKELEAK